MKGNKKVIDVLNQILAGELTAINQYFLHARIFKAWGYEKLAHKTYEESIEEMKHAQSLIDRVLFLEGLPNLQKLNALRIGETVPEMIDADLALEMDALNLLRNAIKICQETEDHVSRELLEHIMDNEEEHVDWLEAQKSLIEQVGVQNYLAQHIHKCD